MATQAAEKVLQLDPTTILAEGNARFGLKRSGTDALKASIQERGRVLQPVAVTPLDPPQNGFTHRLVFGFYRLAAVLELNKEGAGLTLPAIVLDNADDAKLAQIQENVTRESMSPMDKAIAAKQLLDSGVDRGTVRRVFSTMTGKKQIEPKPMSNAMLNILLRFLELPKGIQEKIHDGRVGIEAAYELGKVSPEKRQLVLDRAEADRLKQIEIEERDEEKFLDTERKVTEASEKEQKAEGEAETVKAQIIEAEAQREARVKALNELKQTPYLTLDEAGKKALKEKIDASAADVKASDKVLKDMKNELAKALKTRESAKELAARKRLELEEARKLAKRSGKAGRGVSKVVGVKDVKKAAQSVGEGGSVPLTMADIRSQLKELTADTVPDRVAAAFLIVKMWVEGQTTPKLAIADMLVLVTGKPVPQHLQAAEAPADKPAADPAPKAKGKK